MNEFLKNQYDLLSAWMANKIDLEFFNYYENKWETLDPYDGNIRNLVREVRQAKPIEVPSEIYINIYKNGKMFAHSTEKEAINSIDNEYSNQDVVTVLYSLEGEV
jgi:hypothetical protein